MQSSLWPELFFLEFSGTYIHGDVLSKPDTDSSAPELLLLHSDDSGENRSVFNLLREVLLNRYGLSSCSFDFIGHGSTGGNWNETCLQHRTEQVIEVIDGCFDSQPLSIVAIGSGAFNAVRLLNRQRVANLVLIDPVFPPRILDSLPLYRLAKESAALLPGWSDDARKTLNCFEGNLSLITAQDDIRPGCPASGPEGGKYVATYSHTVIQTPAKQNNLMQFANQNPRVLLQVAEVIGRTVTAAHPHMNIKKLNIS